MQNWKEFIQEEQKKEYYQRIVESIREDKNLYTIYPPEDEIFNAFRFTPLDKVKVVILGQDPYHTPGMAHGLAFSVPHGEPIPPSLKNIYKELKSDLNIDPPNHGNLASWTKQGVMLLNTILTVRKGVAGSHQNIGWNIFTDAAISLLNQQDRPIVFLLWGKYAQSKTSLITNEKHLPLKSGHPSFFSCKMFFGCKHFSKANDFLVKNNMDPIDWKIV